MILEGIEFDTIWRVAHKWANQDPNTNNTESLHPLVSDRLQRMARAAIFRKLSLRDTTNTPVLDSWLLINMIFERKIFWGLRACYFHHKFDQALLDSVYVSRAELLKWCEVGYLSPPQFWLEDNLISKIPEKAKHSPASRRDKAIVAWRSFAQALWLIDPNIHPRHMAESNALKELENVKGYSPDTVRDWIVDLDPLKGVRNTGAPPKIDYLIDLKTGGLNKKGVTTFIEK